MKLSDFSLFDQKQIKDGKPKTSDVDPVAMEKILALLPDGYLKKIPFFIRKHATTRTIARIANEHPDLYEIAKQPGNLPEDAKEVLQKEVTAIFDEKMNKHNIK